MVPGRASFLGGTPSPTSVLYTVIKLTSFTSISPLNTSELLIDISLSIIIVLLAAFFRPNLLTETSFAVTPINDTSLTNLPDISNVLMDISPPTITFFNALTFEVNVMPPSIVLTLKSRILPLPSIMVSFKKFIFPPYKLSITSRTNVDASKTLFTLRSLLIYILLALISSFISIIPPLLICDNLSSEIV